MLKAPMTRLLNLILLTLFTLSAFAAKPPPSIKQCKSKWVLTSPQAKSFGSFVIEGGTDTLIMDSSGTVSTGGNAVLTSAIPTSSFTVTIDNTRSSTVCGTYGFDISWGIAPAALTGPGTTMAHYEVFATEPTLLPTPTDISTPVTLYTANLPITLTFQGKLDTQFPQFAGLYTSPAYTLDLTQSGRITSISSTTTATALTVMSINETVTMDFGTVAGSSTASSVILDTTSTRTVTAGAQILSAGPGSAGSFQVSGEPNLSYFLSVTGPAILENISGQQITVDSFTNNSSGTLPASGTDTFQIGATINLIPLQPVGTYTTTTGGGSPYNVTVNYN